jgi:hypothetical protein
MKADRVDISVDGDTRPVACHCCGRKMYYNGHPKNEPEVTVSVTGPVGLNNCFYAHVRCWTLALAHIGVTGVSVCE